jgi:hypothetical protein
MTTVFPYIRIYIQKKCPGCSKKLSDDKLKLRPQTFGHRPLPTWKKRTCALHWSISQEYGSSTAQAFSSQRGGCMRQARDTHTHTHAHPALIAVSSTPALPSHHPHCNFKTHACTCPSCVHGHIKHVPASPRNTSTGESYIRLN